MANINISSVQEFWKKNRWILVFLCAVPFFNDAYTLFKLMQDWFMDMTKIAVLLFLCVLFVVWKKKPSLLTLCLFLLELWWMVSTLLNYPVSETNVYHKQIIDSVNALAMALIVEYFLDDPKNLTFGLMLNFETTVYPNLALILLGITKDNYLLGPYSVLILWLMPAICIAVIYMIVHKKYIRASLMIAACLATVLIVWNATTVVSFMGMAGVIVLGIILSKVKMLSKYKLPLWLFLLAAVVLNVFTVFVYTGGSFPLFDFFIEKVLHKSVTFTDRTYIWSEAIRMIKEKPFIGHGFRPEVHANNQYGTIFIHSHNQLLQRLNATGVIGLLLFFVFHAVLCIKVDRSKNTFGRLVMVGACFGVFLTYITEAYKKFFRFYLVFFLAYHIDKLIEDKMTGHSELLK